jgi:uncharacterized MAPEG superfamily protein
MAMTGLTALLIFVVWTLLLMFVYVFPRVAQVLVGKKKANAWTRGQPTDDPPLIVRAQHAHMNCVENLPVYAAIVLAASALGRTEAVDGWVAAAFILLRLAQGLVHLAGTSHMLVFVRANLFVPQVLLCFYMIWGLLR